MTRFRGTPIEGATVLVTGANRGLGLAFVQQAKSMGAAKIYAGVRNPDEAPAELRSTGAHIVELDVTDPGLVDAAVRERSEEHTSELQSLMRISYAVFCLKKK